MQVTFETDTGLENTLVAHLEGTVDVVGAESFWVTLSQKVSPDLPFVLIDFSGVGILTSAGIGTMVRLYTRLKGYGGGLAIYGCDERIREIFSIVMLEEVLNVCDSQEEARQKIAQIQSS